MSRKTEAEQIKGIRKYYQESETAYNNWGRDLDREGIYALHCGYEEPGEKIPHWESIKRLTLKVIDFMNIEDGDAVLDAGCGTGAATFEIKEQYPNTTVHGINLALNQLISARTFAQEAGVPGAFFELQDYLETGFKDESFDKIVFIESIAHAQTKKQALAEAYRLLKPGGSLIIADIFFNREFESEVEQEWASDLTRGWFMPDLNSLDTFTAEISETGMELEVIRDISENILPSTLRMRLNSEKRLSESDDDNPVSDEIYWSRRAVVASHKVVESGLIGYYLLKIKKS